MSANGPYEYEPVFGVDWTCVAHGDRCPKLGLDFDCTDAPWAVKMSAETD